MIDKFKVSIVTGIIAAIVVSALFFATNRIDSDKDGLPNSAEQKFGTNPNAWDSDGDSICDSLEVREKTNPLDKTAKPLCCGGPHACVSIK